jgi:hypothetical protein
MAPLHGKDFNNEEAEGKHRRHRGSGLGPFYSENDVFSVRDTCPYLIEFSCSGQLSNLRDIPQFFNLQTEVDYRGRRKRRSWISGSKLKRYYFQEGGLCKTMFLMGSKTMVSGNWLVLR